MANTIAIESTVLHDTSEGNDFVENTRNLFFSYYKGEIPSVTITKSPKSMCIICNTIIIFEKYLSYFSLNFKLYPNYKAQYSKFINIEYTKYLIKLIPMITNNSILELIFAKLGQIYDIPDNFEETEFFNKYLLNDRFSKAFFNHSFNSEKFIESLKNIKDEYSNIEKLIPATDDDTITVTIELDEEHLPYLQKLQKLMGVCSAQDSIVFIPKEAIPVEKPIEEAIPVEKPIEDTKETRPYMQQLLRLCSEQEALLLIHKEAIPVEKPVEEAIPVEKPVEEVLPVEKPDETIYHMDIPYIKSELKNINIFTYTDKEYKITSLPIDKLAEFITNSPDDTFYIKK